MFQPELMLVPAAGVVRCRDRRQTQASLAFYLRAALFLATIILSLGADSASKPLARPQGLDTHIVRPFDNRWLFDATVVRFEAVLVYHGATTRGLSFDVVLTVDGVDVVEARMYMAQIKAQDECLDPRDFLWRSSCGETDFKASFPERAHTLGQHTIVFRVFDTETRALLHRKQQQYYVVEPPVVSLSFPAPSQLFECDGALTMTFSYTINYEPTPDFYEMGAGYHGAAVFINDERGTISDFGFVTTPPIPHGVHQLRVSLFDFSGSEIKASSSAILQVSVSPPATSISSGDHGAGSGGQGCQMVWLRPSADARDTALAALSAAAKPWLEGGEGRQKEQERKSKEKNQERE